MNMRRSGFFAVFLLLAAIPTTGFGQSTLNFPRGFTAADMASTGFAVVNPGSTAASVTFKLFSASGETDSPPETIAARGQLALLGNQLFGAGTATGWVQVTSATTGLSGFWVGGDFATYTDGAGSAISSAHQVLPFINDSTEVDVANPNSTPLVITLTLVNSVGTQPGGPAVMKTIAPNGFLKGKITDFFTSTDATEVARILWLDGATAAGVDSSFCTTSVVTGQILSNLTVPVETAAVNGTYFYPPVPLTELDFPHIVQGPLGSSAYTSLVGVTNLTGNSQTVTITFNPSGGSGGASTSVQKTIVAYGSLRAGAADLFGFTGAGGFQNGWVKVTGTGTITGFVAYAETVAGGFAVVPVQQAPTSVLLFCHIADLPPWYSGMALLNTTSTDAQIQVFAMNPSGTLIGGAVDQPTATFTLPAGQKTSKLLSELVPVDQNRTGDGGFVLVRTTNDVPLYGLELFFLRSGAVYANVAAGTLLPGTNYVPPTPATPVTLTAASPTTVVRGANLILTGTQFSTTAANDLVGFSSMSGLLEVPASTATATSLTVAVPATAISGPVQVRVVGNAATAPLLIQVAATATTLTQDSIALAAGQRVTGADIYVPAPAGAAVNIQTLGVAAVGAATVSIDTTSYTITHGTTMDLYVVASAGVDVNSTITISGAGITYANQRIVNLGGTTGNALVVTVTVASNAVVGPRNVMVTNANLDASILAGGITIK